MWLTRTTGEQQRIMYPSLLLVCFYAVCRVVNANYLENCKNTKIEENVTLKGGIGAGTFRKLGKVTSMDSCIELCCKTSTCDVAFLSASKCYGVECVSDEECKSTTTDTSDIKVLIAHVRTGHKKDNTTLVFITPNFTSSVPPHPNGFLGISKAVVPANSPKGLIAQGQVQTDLGVNPSMAGQCKAGQTFTEVTLKGGINAGTYKDVGSVKTMEECVGKCCEFAACDLAFMLSSRCYLVGCSEGKSCQIQKAKPSPYHPSVSYVARWNKEGVKHTGNRDENKFTCNPMKPMSKVTLKGGLKAGDFTDTGKVGSISECYETCCQQTSCNLAFMLGQNCFSVKCYSKDLCSTIPAQPSIFNPQIAYVLDRKGAPNGSPKAEITRPRVVCPEGKILEGVTLAGGISAGYFRDHGKVKDMQKCRRICCEMPHCNLAFMLSSNCFSVACKSDAACKTQPANPSRYNPKISLVRNYGSKELIGAPPSEQGQPKETILGLPQSPATPAPLAPAQATPTSSQVEVAQLGLFGQTPIPEQTPLFGQQQLQHSQQSQLASLVPPSPPVSPFVPNKPTEQNPFLPVHGSPLSSAAGVQFPIQVTSPNSPMEPKSAVTLVETKKTEIPKAKEDQSLKAQINSSPAGHAIAMNIVNGHLKLTPVGGSNSSEDVPEKTTDSSGADEIHEKSDSEDAKGCKKVKVLSNVTLKAGKNSGKFVNHGDVKGMDECQKICCKDEKCHVAFMLGKTCYSVTCKTKDLCEYSKAPPTDFNPKLSYVRPVEADAKEGSYNAPVIPKSPTNLKCRHSNISNDKDFPDGIHKENFTLLHDADTMAKCMKKCCDSSICDVAYMLNKKCYSVSCSSKEACHTVSVKPSEKTPLISAMIMRAEPSEETDLAEVASSSDDTSTEFSAQKGSCENSRISSDIKLRGGTKASNFTELGSASDIKGCINRCCSRPNCDIAYLLNDKCYAVQCLDGVLCQTNAEPASSGSNVKLAYMNRGASKSKEKDLMIVYVIVASLAFVAAVGGVVWAVCICTKRHKIRKQRRMLDDDEDDEMLPKPTQTRYRTPMPRY